MKMMTSMARLVWMKFLNLNCRRLIPESYANKTFFLVSKKCNLMSEKITFFRFSTETFPSSSGFENNVAVEEEKKKNVNKDKYFDDDDDDDDDEDEDDYDDDDDDDDDDDTTEKSDSENNVAKETKEIFEKIANGDSAVLKELKLLELEISLLKEQGFVLPEHLSEENWKTLLVTPSFKRKKLLVFMGQNEQKSLRRKRNRKKRHENILKKKSEGGFHYYGLGGHALFLRVHDHSLNKLLRHRQLMADLKILIDCSYQKYMNKRNSENLAQQIHMCFNEALCHRYPCQLGLCSLNKNDYLGTIIQNYVHNIYEETFNCDVSEQSVLDIYPKERLMYLSPHAPDDLIEFNKNYIYVIGGFVDKGIGIKASLAKAKRDNIRVARLPLDYYLSWKQGQKSLPLNIVLRVLLDMSFYNDWKKAFKNIAERHKNKFLTENKDFGLSIKEEL